MVSEVMMARRIGFLLANVYQGASLAMWRSIASEAKKEKDSALFVFPGGRLRYSHGNEFLRNSIYDLANSSSLDGAIIWASTLSGEVGTEEAEAFARLMSLEMPVVALGMPIEGCPSVNFDAYGGMKDEIRHLITVHGDRKIAFIRGPENHSSAEDRLEAYRDALAEAGIDFDPRLVSSPHAWADGRSAIAELTEKRGLIPGQDFTAVAAASDMLLLSVVRYFEEIGVDIPERVHAAGFNDNEENMLMAVEPTTVRMPIERLASSSYSLLASMKGRGDIKPDILLPTDLIIRHSCGCRGLEGGGISDLEERVRSRIGRKEALPHLRALISYLLGEGDDALLFSACGSFISAGGDSEALLEAAAVLSKRISSERKDKLFSRIVAEERRVRAQEKQRTRDLTFALDSFKTSLLAAKSLSSLPSIMQSSFKKLGIEKCFLMLYKDFSVTTFAAGFSGSALYLSPVEFPRRNIAPDTLSHEIKSGTFVIEPLFYDAQELGYIVIGTEWCEGYVLEDIRTSLSSALKGISLFEEATEAKEKAEKGERDAETFYAKVSEGIIQPLEDLKAMTERKGRLPRERMIRSILSAEHMLELSLAERGELGITQSLVPASSLLRPLSAFSSVSAPSALPLMDIDRERIVEAISIFSSIVSKGDASVTIEEREEGLTFLISGNGGELDDTARQLAERIVILHSGTVARKDGTIMVTIPYPRLSEGRVTGKGIVFIGASVPDGLAAEPVPPSSLASIRARAIALHSSDKAAAAALLSEKSLRSVPVLLFSDKEDISLRAALEGAAADERTFLLFGSASRLPEPFSELAHIEEASDIDSALSKGHPYALIIMTGVDEALVRDIRRRVRISSIPILIVADSFSSDEVESISDIPNVIIANTAILESTDFLSRIASIAGGSSILPPFTGIVVKKAIVYINSHVTRQISRWRLASSVNISEDYLTRIFRKELGLSPWDYINRYRIQIASSLLVNTSRALSDIAESCGFQDQAYFCRVFKKVKGFSPGQMRQR